MTNHLGNLTFIDQNVNEELQRPPEEYLSEYDEQILEKHFIPTDRELWKMDNYSKFIDRRMDLLWDKYRENFKLTANQPKF